MGEPLVDEADDHRSLADCRGAALDRSGANVADSEDAGRARLEDAVGAGSLAGEHEAVVVESHRAAEPLGAGRRAEEEEEERERDPLAVAERRRLQLAVAAV